MFASFSGRSLPVQGICKPECIILPSILIAATPVDASNKTLNLPGSPLLYLIKCDLPQLPLPARNR